MQGIGESTIAYITDIMTMAKQIKPDMAENEICEHILKGLLPDVLKYVSMHDNSTLDKLRDNLKKYESLSYNLHRHQNAQVKKELISHVCAVDTRIPPPTKSDSTIIDDLKAQIAAMAKEIAELKAKADTNRTNNRRSHYNRSKYQHPQQQQQQQWTAQQQQSRPQENAPNAFKPQDRQPDQPTLFCAYCKKLNHNIQSCFKLNRKNSQQRS